MTQRAGDPARPDAVDRQRRTPPARRQRRRGDQRTAARHGDDARSAPGARVALEARQAPPRRRGARPGSALRRPSATAAARKRAARRRRRDRVLVGLEHRVGHQRPREACARRAAAADIASRARASPASSSIACGERAGVTAREEHAVDAVADDVAVAGDVGRDDRRATANASVRIMPKLSPPSDGATSRSAPPSTAVLRASSTLPERAAPRAGRASSPQLLGVDADDVEGRRGRARAAPRTPAGRPAAPCARPPARRTRAAAGAPRSARRPARARAAPAPTTPLGITR